MFWHLSKVFCFNTCQALDLLHFSHKAQPCDNQVCILILVGLFSYCRSSDSIFLRHWLCLLLQQEVHLSLQKSSFFLSCHFAVLQKCKTSIFNLGLTWWFMWGFTSCWCWHDAASTTASNCQDTTIMKGENLQLQHNQIKLCCSWLALCKKANYSLKRFFGVSESPSTSKIKIADLYPLCFSPALFLLTLHYYHAGRKWKEIQTAGVKRAKRRFLKRALDLNKPLSGQQVSWCMHNGRRCG